MYVNFFGVQSSGFCSEAWFGDVREEEVSFVFAASVMFYFRGAKPAQTIVVNFEFLHRIPL